MTGRRRRTVRPHGRRLNPRATSTLGARDEMRWGGDVTPADLEPHDASSFTDTTSRKIPNALRSIASDIAPASLAPK